MRTRFAFFLACSLFSGVVHADLATFQVEIEARIVETSRDFVRDLGVFSFNGEGANALAKKDDQQIWFFGLNVADHQVYRMPITVWPQFQANLSALEKFDQNKILFTPKVQTATNSQGITLVMTPEVKFIEAAQSGDDGLKNSKYFRISSISSDIITGGISSDGRVSVISKQKTPDSEIELRFLNSRSRRTSKLVVLVTPNIIGSADISDPQDDVFRRTTALTRFLVYRAFRQAGSAVQSALFLQVIDAETGAAIGTPKVLRSYKKTNLVTAEFFQSVAIDPDGEYVLYTAYKSSCGKLLLYRQPLDSNGNKVGRAKVEVGCSGVRNSTVGVTGLDILDND